MGCVNKEEMYRFYQKQWVDANDVKIGDEVVVTGKPSKIEIEKSGWGDDWVNGMDEFVGMTCEVAYVSVQEKNNGIDLFNPDENKTDYFFPFFVLKKVEKR